MNEHINSHTALKTLRDNAEYLKDTLQKLMISFGDVTFHYAGTMQEDDIPIRDSMQIGFKTECSVTYRNFLEQRTRELINEFLGVTLAPDVIITGFQAKYFVIIYSADNTDYSKIIDKLYIPI